MQSVFIPVSSEIIIICLQVDLSGLNVVFFLPCDDHLPYRSFSMNLLYASLSNLMLFDIAVVGLYWSRFLYSLTIVRRRTYPRLHMVALIHNLLTWMPRRPNHPRRWYPSLWS